MENNNKYTVLIMRDDKKVRHLRLSPFWFKLTLWLLLFLLLCAGGGIGGSYYFWNKGHADAVRLAQIERENSDLCIKLERLQNMETLIGASENAPPPVEDTGPTETAPAVNASHGAVDTGNLPALVDMSDNATLADNATLPEGGDNATLAAGDKPVKLENINLRVNSSKTLRLSMNFVNNSGKPVRGYASLKLLTSSGEVPATVPSDDLDFQITRMKRVTTTFPLPEGVEMNSIESVRITVFVNEIETLTEEVPLER